MEIIRLLKQRKVLFTYLGYPIFVLNLLNLAAVSYLFFRCSIEVFFAQDRQVGTVLFDHFNWIFFVFFLINLPLQFLSEQYYDGKIIKQLNSIAKVVLKRQFFPDLTVVVVLAVSFSNLLPFNARWVILIVYLKVVKVLLVNQNLQLGARNLTFLTSYGIIKIIFLQVFCCNIFGSLFFLIDLYLYFQKIYPEQQLWLFNSSAWVDIYSLTSYQQYLYAFYWALTTSTTTGYGDIIPLNPPQAYFVLFVYFFSIILFTYYINTFWEIINKFVESQPLFLELEGYMFRYKVPINLRYKIIRHLAHQHLHNHQLLTPEFTRIFISKNLAAPCQQRLLSQLIPMDKDFLKRKVVSIMQEANLSQGQFFEPVGEMGCLSSGRVVLCIRDRPNHILELKQIQIIGLRQFLSGFRGSLLYKGGQVSRVITLNKAKFITVLSQFDRKVLLWFKRQCQQAYQHLPCTICKEKHHQTKCHHLHLVVQPEELYKKVKTKQEQIRSYFDRGELKSRRMRGVHVPEQTGSRKVGTQKQAIQFQTIGQEIGFMQISNICDED